MSDDIELYSADNGREALRNFNPAPRKPFEGGIGLAAFLWTNF